MKNKRVMIFVGLSLIFLFAFLFSINSIFVSAQTPPTIGAVSPTYAIAGKLETFSASVSDPNALLVSCSFSPMYFEGKPYLKTMATYDMKGGVVSADYNYTYISSEKYTAFFECTDGITNYRGVQTLIAVEPASVVEPLTWTPATPADSTIPSNQVLIFTANRIPASGEEMAEVTSQIFIPQIPAIFIADGVEVFHEDIIRFTASLTRDGLLRIMYSLPDNSIKTLFYSESTTLALTTEFPIKYYYSTEPGTVEIPLLASNFVINYIPGGPSTFTIDGVFVPLTSLLIPEELTKKVLTENVGYTKTVGDLNRRMVISPIAPNWVDGQRICVKLSWGLFCYPVKATLPQGISGVTGTVGITAVAGGTFGDTLTLTGGATGGDINIVDSLGAVTTKLSVPANTETSLSVNSAGELKFFSTTATMSNFLKLENLKSTFLNTYLKKQNEALLRFGGQQSMEIYQQDVQTFGFKSFSANTQDVQFSISAGASSDCNAETCASLGGHCVGNWCMPNTEILDAFSTRGASISGKLSPNEDLSFSSELTPSAHNILKINTLSGFGFPAVKYKIGSLDIARLKLPANGEVEFFLDDVKYVAGIIPNSAGIEFSSLLPGIDSPYNLYGIKNRALDKGSIQTAGPANYKFETNGDSMFDLEYNSKAQNRFFSKVVGSGYDTLSPTGANGINFVVFSLTTNLAPELTVNYKGVSQRKFLTQNDATAFNFIIQKDKLGNPVTLAGNSRTITGSLIEEISPAAIIEGWNYFYTATDDNYWTWNVVLESLPSGCVADKTTASAIVANGVQTLAFNVDCGTASATTGSVISGFATSEGKRGFATKGKASLLSSFSDCTKTNSNGLHICQPTQQFREEAAQVVKGVMNPTGSVVSGLGETESSILIVISLLTLAGIIALIALQVRRKSVDW